MSQALMAQRERELKEDLSVLDDWKERYGYILDLGAALPPFPEEFRRDEFKVRGCVSQVWLVGKKEGDQIKFFVDSDSLFVKGLAGLLVKLFSDLPAKEIADYSGNILIETGLLQNLSPNRVNGAGAMLSKFKEYGKVFS